MLFRKAHLVALGAAGLLTLLLLNLPAAAAARLKMAAGSIFLPWFGLVSSTQSFVDRASWLAVPRRSLIDQVRRLEQTNALLQIELMRASEQARQHEAIARDHGWTRTLPWKVRPARVIGRDPTTWWRTAQIDLGTREGARVNQPVLLPEGLVGRVSEVSPFSSRISLIGDVDCGVSVMVRETRDFGIIRGPQAVSDAGLIDMSLTQNNPNLLAGQGVVTSGLGGVFPPGIVVGTIADTRPAGGGLYTAARLKPGADLARLDRVWIIQP